MGRTLKAMSEGKSMFIAIATLTRSEQKRQNETESKSYLGTGYHLIQSAVLKNQEIGHTPKKLTKDGITGGIRECFKESEVYC